MLRSFVLPMLLAGSFLSLLPAQSWVEVGDRPRFEVAIFADAGRDGGPLMIRRREVHEWHGSGWRKIAVLPPGVFSVIDATYDSDREKTVFLVTANPTQFVVGTYELDAVGWSGFGPAPGSFVSDLCYDPVTRLVVGFGESGTTQTTQDHVWTGSTWLPLTANLRPFHVQQQLVTDRARSRIIAFTPAQPGPAGETWEWDGAAWTQFNPANVPPLRDITVMTHDRSAGGIVMFGGADGNIALRDTWRWDGTDWTQLPTGPAAANASGYTALTFDRFHETPLLIDRANQSVVDYHLSPNGWLAGSASGPTRDQYAVGNDFSRGTMVLHDGVWTHVWDGFDWTRSAIGGPSRRRSRIAFDWSSNDLLLFGGVAAGVYPNPTVTLNDTWTFNGAAWQQRSPSMPPPARQQHALVSSFGLSGVLLFGGLNTSGAPLADTWVWRQGGWLDFTPGLTSEPPGGRSSGGVGAPGVATMVLSGGELWEFNGVWNLIDAQVPPMSAVQLGITPQGTTIVTGIVSSPIPGVYERVNGSWVPRPAGPAWFSHHALDPARGNLLGFDRAEAYAYTTTPATSVNYGSGCGAPELELLAAGRATIGTDVAVQAEDVQGLVMFAAGLTPAQTPLGSACTLNVGQSVIAGFVSANSFGVAGLPLSIPNDPAFRQLDLFFQAANLQSGGPYLGMRLSPGLRLTVGD